MSLSISFSRRDDLLLVKFLSIYPSLYLLLATRCFCSLLSPSRWTFIEKEHTGNVVHISRVLWWFFWHEMDATQSIPLLRTPFVPTHGGYPLISPSSILRETENFYLAALFLVYWHSQQQHNWSPWLKPCKTAHSRRPSAAFLPYKMAEIFLRVTLMTSSCK